MRNRELKILKIEGVERIEWSGKCEKRKLKNCKIEKLLGVVMSDDHPH